MKRLESLVADRPTAAQELEEFRDLLQSKTELREKQDLLPFFRRRKQLIALLGCLHDVVIVDRVGWEFDLFGDFIADFVAGSTKQCAYSFIEFQDAVPNSLFHHGGRSHGKWAPSFEEAFSQIIDWSYKLDDYGRTDEFRNRFGSDVADVSFIIVVGRDSFLDPSEMQRLKWRRRHIALRSRQIKCLTYDELLRHFDVLTNQLFRAAQTDAK